MTPWLTTLCCRGTVFWSQIELSVHNYEETDSNGECQLVKIFCRELLIAKKIKQNKSIRFFGIKGYKQYLTQEDVLK